MPPTEWMRVRIKIVNEWVIEQCRRRQRRWWQRRRHMFPHIKMHVRNETKSLYTSRCRSVLTESVQRCHIRGLSYMCLFRILFFFSLALSLSLSSYCVFTFLVIDSGSIFLWQQLLEPHSHKAISLYTHILYESYGMVVDTSNVSPNAEFSAWCRL